MEYIFLSGVHGVGKSTLLRKISKDKSIISASVSDLIRLAGKDIMHNNKLTKNIEENQNLWKQKLSEFSLLEAEHLILDGHFCLLNSKGEITILPDDTFQGTEMRKIILKKEDPEIIKKRIEIRDGVSWKLEKIKAFQKLEEERAIYFSKKNNIPIFVFDNYELYSELLEFI